MIIPIVTAVIEIFVLFCIGLFARRLEYIKENSLDDWSKFIVDILFPLLIFSSIVQDFEVKRIGELWTLPLIGIGLVAIGVLAGIPLRLLLRKSDRDVVKTFHHFCAVNNYSFLPAIMIASVMGEKALANLFFLNLGSHAALWTIGIALLGGRRFLTDFKLLITPNFLALILALVCSLLNARQFIPPPILDAFLFAGSAAIPCAIILVGASLYKTRLNLFPYEITLITIVRNIALPVISILLLRLFRLSGDVLTVSIIVAVMPVNVSAAIYTRRFGGSTNFAAATVLVSTLAGIITMPILLSIFLPK